MLKPSEINPLLDRFEEEIAARTAANNGRVTGCVLCRRSDRREVNRTILEGALNDGAIGKLYGVDRNMILHHKMHCLVKYANATFTAVQRYQEQRRKLFPVTGKPKAQKRFFLDELLFVRDEALKKNPIDRKEIARLAKEIDAAATEYVKAREAAKKPRKKNEVDNLADEFTSEQLEQMEMVKKRIAEGSNGGPRQAE